MSARGVVLACLALLATLLAGCGGSAPTDPRPDVRDVAPAITTTPETTGTVPRAETALAPAATCAAGNAFACSTLRVPLSSTGRPAGSLRLSVAVQRVASAPRGTLLVLTGGPGQPGLPFGPAVLQRLGAVVAGYRVVVLDQRGTGTDAIRCRRLQAAVGSSDLAVPPAGAVEDCSRSLGPLRSAFGTGATVADIEALRVALRAPELTVAGISYGTYVAERYAIAHPRRVTRLVLDSVVPADGVDALQRSVLRATPRVLRAVCARSGDCEGDPVSDLRRTLARDDVDGPAVLDAIVARSVGTPDLADVPAALRAAAGGSTTLLDGLVDDARRGRTADADELSAGLHAATLCADARTPWQSSGTLPADREQALALARDRLVRGGLGGWDPATATGNGLIDTCLRWAPLDPVPDRPTGATLPAVPTLLLAGQLDLSTPLSDARAQAADAPGGQLLEVRGAGHAILLGQATPCVRAVTRRFLTGRAPGRTSCPAASSG